MTDALALRPSRTDAIAAEMLAALDARCERVGSFAITLVRDGIAADEGRATNVLGAVGGAAPPRRGARGRPGELPLEAGEIVTTGTLTKALPIAPGETWSTRLDGVPLDGVSVTFA